jgi:hypothetical protein
MLWASSLRDVGIVCELESTLELEFAMVSFALSTVLRCLWTLELLMMESYWKEMGKRPNKRIHIVSYKQLLSLDCQGRLRCNWSASSFCQRVVRPSWVHPKGGAFLRAPVKCGLLLITKGRHIVALLLIINENPSCSAVDSLKSSTAGLRMKQLGLIVLALGPVRQRRRISSADNYRS